MLSKVKDSNKLFKKTTQHAEGTITPNKQMQLPFFKTSRYYKKSSKLHKPIFLFIILIYRLQAYKLIILQVYIMSISIVNVINL